MQYNTKSENKDALIKTLGITLHQPLGTELVVLMNKSKGLFQSDWTRDLSEVAQWNREKTSLLLTKCKRACPDLGYLI